MIGKYSRMKSTNPINPGVVIPALHGSVNLINRLTSYYHKCGLPFWQRIAHVQEARAEGVQDDHEGLSTEVHLCTIKDKALEDIQHDDYRIFSISMLRHCCPKTDPTLPKYDPQSPKVERASIP